MTDEVLAASAKAAPLTDIRVTLVSMDGDEYYPEAKVRATYRLGGSPAEQTFTVHGSVDHGSGTSSTTWSLIDAAATFSPASSLKGLEVAVNGQAVRTSTKDLYLVVPGAYQVTATSPYYTLDNADLRLTDPYSSSVWHITPALTDAGVEVFRTAVSGAVDACLASKNLTAGCGLDVAATLDDGTTVDDGSLTRTLTPEAQAALAALAPTLDPTNPSVATCTGTIGGVTTTATGTVDGRHATFEITQTYALLANLGGGAPLNLKHPSVTMTDPALPVTW